MATRDDLTVDYLASPRVITVPKDGSDPTELIAQDSIDTLRIIEESFNGMAYPKLVNASGKEPLGGGVEVGITLAYQNAAVAFEGRYDPAETGTVTTGSSAPVQGTINFIDTSATFITNSVKRGSVVFNTTDGSVTDVVEVISETELKILVPINGTGNTFDVADAYKVFNITQVTIGGGNHTAVDDLQAEISPVIPTFGTQVVRVTSSSATTQNLAALEYASFRGGVTIDTANGVAGTEFPIGTGLSPSNNLADALSIANTRGFKTFFVKGTLTLSSGDMSTGFTFFGESKLNSIVTLGAGTDVDNCEFEKLTISGVLDNNNIIRDCIVNAITSFDGVIENSLINGPITLGGSQQTTIEKCYSNVAGGVNTVIIDWNGQTSDFVLRDYHGGVEFRNLTTANISSVDMSSGQVRVNDNCTAGSIVLRGVAKWDNEATYVGTTTVTNELVEAADIKDIRQAHFNRRIIDIVNNQIVLYENDGTTEKQRFDLNADWQTAGITSITPV